MSVSSMYCVQPVCVDAHKKQGMTARLRCRALQEGCLVCHVKHSHYWSHQLAAATQEIARVCRLGKAQHTIVILLLQNSD